MDTIAVLDGIGINPSASDGGNYGGGSSWAPGFPTYPSTEGLAGYLAAFSNSSFTAQAERVNPSASDGGNYGGGSSWAPGFPTYPSTEGLAGTQGYEITPVRMNPSASDGGNYSGGSSWSSGFPTYPSTEGLAGVAPSLYRVRARAILHGLTYGGVSPARAVQVAKQVLRNASFRATSPCDAAWEATYKAALAAGFDRTFAKDAADSSGNRCRNEAWSALATKS